MGQKANPKAIRLAVNKPWNSRWFSKKREFAQVLKQDVLIRRYLKHRITEAGLSHIAIERTGGALNISIFAAKPGVIIGRSGAGIEELKKEIVTKFLNKEATRIQGTTAVNISIHEVERPMLSAQIVLDQIIADIEKRMPHRRVMKSAISRVEKAGAKGIKVYVGGRLGGNEIARRETLSSGRLPLQTLRADIDYARGHAQMTYGKIGVKVWIYRGDVFEKEQASATPAATRPIQK